MQSKYICKDLWDCVIFVFVFILGEGLRFSTLSLSMAAPTYPKDPNGQPFPSMEELEKELPFVLDGQIHLGLVMHQMVQDLYSQLLNIAET
jgi:hypothetical protein